ncbi:30S ribosomal protein S27e [Candidatus Bathyarchaeota archaeon]|jgi:small subunit ribosomal protein S27e|nr:30S ribosomal protein S27e [Candidatus Bathyarchaeota archaeon]
MAEWEKLIPRPRSSFLRVKCPKCGNEQVVFDSAANKVNCNVCGAELAEPSGGKAKVKGEIVAVFE